MQSRLLGQPGEGNRFTQVFGDFTGSRCAESARHPLVNGNAYTQQKIVVIHLLFNALDDFPEKARPIFKRTAVASLPGVGRLQKFVAEKAVGMFDFHSVGTGFMGQQGSMDELIPQLLNFIIG